ncbi:NAD(P)H-quinone oxidoreductase [Pseudomonadales bacterium]|jgi:putative PIG3 family NAD(P)H quinone oxidoreductase|nr:NAD(P)H-quinone oxidoreductase [Gammaproteobacteria bacterium]MDA7590058.1 NAD(P)H-quinone oxidoreductase [Pseudomonadales bacterium]MBT7885362.1 NAD(P)H-quinone oxidoreductase [Gammaproteobacteria bacterium]MCH9820685.1 NAD(P)H-quinone oxidoreductase [Gammaproteobacteria bacterium]MCO4829290.1 NAD(P)H-quinone oxidoreductase [Gammaproteobacteria bacterium]
MRVISVSETGDLLWTEAADLVPSPAEILIDVKATAINRADLMQRKGLYPPPPGAPETMGLECAGIVMAVGRDVTHHQVGDRVCALLAGGGYAEQAVVDQGSALKIPDNLDFEQAAAIPEVFATAWLNLFIEAALQPGERVVLHAGASGVGTAAIQLCHAFGSESFVTAGSASKIEACLKLGAKGGHNRRDGGFIDALRALWPQGADVILDPVGASYLAENLEALTLNGRLVLIGLMGGSRSEIDLAKLMMKRLRVVGSTLRARPLEEKASIMAELSQYVWPKISQGEIVPIIQQVFPIQSASAAHELMASDVTIGKVVLKVSS